MLLIFAFGGQSASSRDGRGHPLSVGATGFKALVTLSGAFGGGDARRRRRGAGAAGLVVVAIEPQSSAEDVARLLELRRGLPTLLILPKWLTMPDPSHRGWVRAIGPGVGARGAALIDGRASSVRARDGRGGRPARGAALAGISVPEPSSPQIVQRRRRCMPCSPLPGRGALIAQLGNEPHYIVADPDLFNNHGLQDPARRAAALAILARLRPAKRADRLRSHRQRLRRAAPART